MNVPSFRALFLLLAAPALATLLQGCASRAPRLEAAREETPAVRVARVQWEELSRLASSESKSWSVAMVHLRDMPWLAADPETKIRLVGLESRAGDPGAFEAEASPTLERMIELAWSSHETSLHGMDEADALADMARPAFETLAAREKELLAGLSTPDERRAWVERLLEAIPGDPDGSGPALRMISALPLAPVLYAWMGYHILIEHRGPNPLDFERARVYSPEAEPRGEVASRLELATESELLDFYSPVIVQEVVEGAGYSPEIDRVGFAELHEAEDGSPAARVNPERPEVYASASKAFLRGEWLTQLNYTFWYPEHPVLHGSFDPEAGPVEGWALRLTLDAGNRPLVAETVAACGCYHRVFPIDELEEAAWGEFGNVESNRHALGRANRFKIDAFIPETLGRFDASAPRPAVFVASGTHQVAAVKLGHPLPESAAESQSYGLVARERLFHLPWKDGSASFFESDGLARGADRLEATLLYPTGIYHAGTPRLAERRLIHFDQYDWSDPALLERLLRLPEKLPPSAS